MPTYETLVDGKLRMIELARNGTQDFTARIDEKPVKVQLLSRELKPQEQFSIRIGEKTYRAEITAMVQGKNLRVKIDEATFNAEVKTFVRKQESITSGTGPTVRSRNSTVARQQTAEGAITSPMTGKVISVKVKKGDKVKQGQTLCLIEAMKMENEVTALKAGTVQEVSVSEGSPVNEGETLIVVT